MPRILIIDSDDYARDWLRDVLSEARHEVGVAPNGRAALQQLNQCPADLVITEMLLPEMDGVETIIALRRGHPDTKIIAISAGAIVAAYTYLRLARALGVDLTLAKPFTQSEMLDSIQELFRTP